MLLFPAISLPTSLFFLWTGFSRQPTLYALTSVDRIEINAAKILFLLMPFSYFGVALSITIIGGLLTYLLYWLQELR